MLILSHSYKIPHGIKPQDYDVLYQEWLRAKKEKDYNRADELREWFEFWHGQTIIREGEYVYSARDKDGNPTGTVVGTRPSLWVRKYFNYLNLKYPKDYSRERLIEALDARRNGLDIKLEATGYVTYAANKITS